MIRIIKNLASLKITVTCLSFLFILTLWGTLDQAQNGLYLAQEKFFNSLFFMIKGVIPFPGARSVLWVLFINLICAARVRLIYQWKQAGIIITHIGLLLFFISAFVIFHGSLESNITLAEQEGSNLSTAYHKWELSLWKLGEEKKQVLAFDSDHFQSGQKLDFPKYGLSIGVKKYLRNCEAYRTSDVEEHIHNASGIKRLESIDINTEPGRNFPGGIFEVYGADEKDLKIILYGGEGKATAIQKNGVPYVVRLRRKRYILPFVIKLKDFRKETHPNTQMARSYESLVDIISPEGITREVLISMNKPLRYKDFTLYQSSYAIGQEGQEFSTLSVVKNAGRLLPYISSLTVCVGLLIHLILMGFKKKRRK